MSGAVVADWLDVTCSPDDFDQVRGVIEGVLMRADCSSKEDGQWRGPSGSGLVRIEQRRRGGNSYGKLSASGEILAHLRACGLFLDYLAALSGVPHRITRLDCALDTEEDGADVVRRYRRRYGRSCRVRLSHKAVRSWFYTSAREDGRETGTFYVGDRRKAEITARVYDKAQQLAEAKGVCSPPRTRYELTVRKGLASLRDAAEPDRLFWHYMAPGLLRRPAGVPAWESGWGGEWVQEPADADLWALLRYRVATSGELAALFRLAEQAGAEGPAYLFRLLRRQYAPAEPADS